VSSFPPQKPQPFDREAVAAFRAGVRGCYGLFCRERWVYIGKGDIRERLLAHLDGDRPWTAAEEPTHWVAVQTDASDAVERELIASCGPLCNHRTGP
jgi:hypothetical protein